MADFGFISGENIVSWVSISPDRIILPYLDDSIVRKAVIAMVSEQVRADMWNAAEEWQIEDRITDELDKAMVSICLDLIPSCTSPHVGFIVRVRLADGRELKREVFVKESSAAAVNLVTAFLENGAQGITDEARESAKYQIECYIRSRQIQGRV